MNDRLRKSIAARLWQRAPCSTPSRTGTKLKGINHLLNAAVLHVLSAMGHGDDLIIADTNFPSESVAKQTVHGRLLRIHCSAPSPRDSHAWTFLHIRTVGHYQLGILDEAVKAAWASVRQTNTTYWAFATLASILGARGKAEDAAPITNELLKLKPNYSCQFAAKEFLHQKDVDFMTRYLEGLRKVGLPD